MTVLVTGGAGFIGSHVVKKLLASGEKVIAVDDFNDYYDVSLKEDRVRELKGNPNFLMSRTDIRDTGALGAIFAEHKIDKVCHLAARAGVRASLADPVLYCQTNIEGTLNLLEAMRANLVQDLVFASSSSVYSGNEKVPFSEADRVERPLSPYAATKKAGELLVYNYHRLYGLRATCLRFFTVYGPWGRPDMAYFGFAKKIVAGEPIDVYNYGKMKRDFTYIDEIVEGIVHALERPFAFEIINLGHSEPVELEYFISLLEKELGRKAEKNYLPQQPGDPLVTFADVTHAAELLDFETSTSIEEGIAKFASWFKDYYKLTS